ncbi:MAG: PEP-utilizing enzyme [Patescibacteria group bacterium]
MAKNKQKLSLARNQKLDNLELVYKTSITPFFPICQVGRHYSRRFQKILVLNNQPQELVVAITPSGVNWFFPRTLKPIAIRYVDKLLSDRRILPALLGQERSLSRQLLRIIKTPIPVLVKDGQITALGRKLFHDILTLYYDYGYIADVPGFIFQVYAVDYFKERIEKQLYQAGQAALATDENLDLLLTSPGYTNYENFLQDLAGLKEKQAVSVVTRRWSWLIHDYIGTVIDEKYIISKIKQLGRSQINKDLRQAEQRIAAIGRVKRLLPVRARQETEIVQKFLWIYNDRKKEVLNQVNIYLRRLFEAKFPGLSFSQLRELYQHRPDDLEKIFSSPRPLSVWLKQKKFIYIIKNGRVTNGPASYFSLIDRPVLAADKILRGKTACVGLVRGRVNVVLNISQITKFVPGSILVAPFTNVNYLPIMSKAGAILTETGGLTSHAAITARELKIPCVVGIPHLLANLYDGQEVEVDAGKGTIRII